MKKLAIGSVLLLGLAAVAQVPASKPAVTSDKVQAAANSAATAKIETLHGWVVDEVCGRVTGRTSEHATCAKMCSRTIHKTLIFVSDYNGVNVKVKNQEALKPYLGKHLDIEAKLLAPLEIEVLRVEPASANASPNDPIAAHDNAPLIPTAEWKKPVWAESAQPQPKMKKAK
jgi:hypothetical protein